MQKHQKQEVVDLGQCWSQVFNYFVTEALFLEMIILNSFLSQLFKKKTKKQTMKF